MKKIKHFIVTYNNEKRINESLKSLFESDLNNNIEVFIISNHSYLNIHDEFIKKVKILRNETRPDFSTGHLSRNWNQAIINGFQNLNNPDCDILITSQDDTIFKKNYIERSVELSESFDFSVFGSGDQFAIYTPNAIKKIGLWDERLCNIGYQEADYFLRAIKYCDRVSINDYRHGRVYNPQNNNPITETPTGWDYKDVAHMASMVYHQHSLYIFEKKWETRPMDWVVKNKGYVDDNYMNYLKNIEPMIPSFILYPYFEKNIETLREQKFIIE
jgi:hypothetical protein